MGCIREKIYLEKDISLLGSKPPIGQNCFVKNEQELKYQYFTMIDKKYNSEVEIIINGKKIDIDGEKHVIIREKI